MVTTPARTTDAPDDTGSGGRPAWRPLAVAAIGASLLVTTGVGVMAALMANVSNVAPQSVDSGTLELTLADNGAGFTQAVGNLAPADTVHRYVTLTNDGSLDARDLTFSATATGTASLITDGAAPATTKALRVGLTSCSVPWDPATGTCSGVTTSLLGPTVLSAVQQPQSLPVGPLDATERVNLRVQMTLPDQNEITVNGVPPAQTVQGGAVSITYTFTAAQRAGITRND